MHAEVHLANWFFDGARADVAKVISANPAFQIQHSFSLGSATKPPAYNFGAIFASGSVSPASAAAVSMAYQDRHSCREVSTGRGW